MRFEDRRLLTLSMMRGIAISALMCFVVVFAAAQPKSGRKTAFDSIQHVGEVVITQNLTYREVIPSHTHQARDSARDGRRLPFPVHGPRAREAGARTGTPECT